MSLSPLHHQILRFRQNLRSRSIEKFYIILQFSYLSFTHLQHSSFTSAGFYSVFIIYSTSSFPFHFIIFSFFSLFSHSDIDPSGIPEYFFMNLNISFFLCHFIQYWRWHFPSSFNETVSVSDHLYSLHYNIILPHNNAWNNSEIVQW